MTVYVPSRLVGLLLSVIICVTVTAQPLSGQPKIGKGPDAGVALRNRPGLLLTNVKLITQKVFVRFSPRDIYYKHLNSSLPPNYQLSHKTRGWVETTLTHAEQDTRNILMQLEKLALTIEELSDYTVHSRTKSTRAELNKPERKKRFAIALVSAAAALGSLFSLGTSAVNTVSIKTLQTQVREIQQDLPSFRKAINTNSESVRTLGFQLKDTIIMVNQHTTLLDAAMRQISRMESVLGFEFSHYQNTDLLMSDYLRELSSSVDTLALGRIPPYLTPLTLIQRILSKATGEKVTETQAALAYSLGGALILSVDPMNLELAFLLTLPVVNKYDVYRTKDVLNNGFWQNDTYVRFDTPTLVAFHETSPSLQLVPNLKLCTLTKEIHYLCASKPFYASSSDSGFCALSDAPFGGKCKAQVTPRHQVTETRVEILGQDWLVNTPATTATVRFEIHDITSTIELPKQTFLLTVPENTIVQIDDQVLYHLPTEVYHSEIELSDFFQNLRLEIDPITTQQISDGLKQIDLTAVDQVLKTTPNVPDRYYTLVSSWSTTDSLLLTLLIISYLAVIALSCWTVRRFKGIRLANERLSNSHTLLVRDNRRKSINNTSEKGLDPLPLKESV